MSIERQRAETRSIFPISTLAAIDSYVWMKNNLEVPSENRVDPLAQGEEIAKLRKQQPNLFLFLDQMKHLRGAVMFAQDNKFSYDNGVLFMMRTFQNQFRASGRSFPTLSEASLLNYFQNLIDVEVSHYDVEELKQAQGIDSNTPFLPYALANLALDPKAQTPALLRIKETFTLKSEDAAHYLCDDEEFGRDIILKGEVANKFGPIMGFVYGATDVYNALEQFEQAKSLRRLLRIEIK